MTRGSGGFLEPGKIIKELNIRKDMIIADFGCGAGYFTIPLAKMAEEGRVYAIDVLEESIEAVQSRIKLEGLFNIETRHADLEILKGSGLEDNLVDLVLLGNILFQSSKKTDIIKEAKRVLKKGGNLVIIDWKPNQPMGPPEKLIISPEDTREIAKKQNLIFEKEFSVDNYHWGMVFRK